MNKIQLPTVDLVAMATTNVEATVKALIHSCKEIDYNNVILISHYKPENLPDYIQWKYTDQFSNVDEWCYHMIFSLHRYISENATHALCIHHDGYVVNPDSWQQSWLEMDYIGSPWRIPPATDTISFRATDGTLVRCGNSVSLRSKKILELPTQLNLEWKSYHGYSHDDGYLCVNQRLVLQEHGIKFADIDVAKYFGRESDIPENENIDNPFLFHHFDGRNAQYRLI